MCGSVQNEESVRVQRCIGSTSNNFCSEVDSLLSSRFQKLEISSPPSRSTIVCGSTQIRYCKNYQSPASRMVWRKQQAASPASFDVCRDMEQFSVGGMQFRKIPYCPSPETVKHAKSIFRLYANGPFSWDVLKSAFMNFNKYLCRGGWFGRAEVPDYKQFAYLQAVEESSLPFPRKGKMPDFSKRVYPNWITRLTHYRFLCKVLTFNEDENEFAALMDEYFIWRKKNFKIVRCQAQMFAVNYVVDKVLDNVEQRYPKAAKMANEPEEAAAKIAQEVLNQNPEVSKIIKDPVGGVCSSLYEKIKKVFEDVFVNFPLKVVDALKDAAENISFSKIFELLKWCFDSVKGMVLQICRQFYENFATTFVTSYSLVLFCIFVYLSWDKFGSFVSILKLGMAKLVESLGYFTGPFWWDLFDKVFGSSRPQAQGFTMTGGIIAAIGYFVVATMKPTTMANYSSFVNVVSRSGSLMDNFVEIITDVVDSVYFYVMDEHLFPSKETMEKFDTYWQEMTAFAATPGLSEKVLVDKTKTQELANVVARGADLYAALKHFKGPLCSVYMKTYEGLRMLHDEALASADMYKKRIETMCVWLMGEPGQGKTLMLRTIPELLHQMMKKKFPSEYPDWSPSLVFEKVKDSDYWETYGGQPYCVMNEVVNKKDEMTRAKELSTIQSICDSAPLPLNVAFTLKGKVFFRSEVLVTTTNIDNSEFGTERQNKTGLTCPVSMIRRQTFPLHVIRGETLKPDASNFDKAWIFMVAFPRKCCDPDGPFWKEAFLGISRFLGISPKSKDFEEGPHHKHFVQNGCRISFPLSYVVTAMFKELCLRKRAGATATIGSRIPMPLPREIPNDYSPEWTTFEELSGALEIKVEDSDEFIQTKLQVAVLPAVPDNCIKSEAQNGDDDESSSVSVVIEDSTESTDISGEEFGNLVREQIKTTGRPPAVVLPTGSTFRPGRQSSAFMYDGVMRPSVLQHVYNFEDEGLMVPITNTVSMADCGESVSGERGVGRIFRKDVHAVQSSDVEGSNLLDSSSSEEIHNEDHWTAKWVRKLNNFVPLNYSSDVTCVLARCDVQNSMYNGKCTFIHDRIITGDLYYIDDCTKCCIESWYGFLCKANWEDVRSVFRAARNCRVGNVCDKKNFINFIAPILKKYPDFLLPGDAPLVRNTCILAMGSFGRYNIHEGSEVHVLETGFSVLIGAMLRVFSMEEDCVYSCGRKADSSVHFEAQKFAIQEMSHIAKKRTLYSTMLNYLDYKPKIDVSACEVFLTVFQNMRDYYNQIVNDHPWFKWVTYGACAVGCIALILKPLIDWALPSEENQTFDSALWAVSHGGVLSKTTPESQSAVHRTAYVPGPMAPQTQSVVHRSSYVPPEMRATTQGFDEAVGRAGQIASNIRMLQFSYADGTEFKSWGLMSGTSAIMTCHPLRGWGTNFAIMRVLAHGDQPELSVERKFVVIRMGDNGEMGGGKRDICFLDITGTALGTIFPSLRKFCPSSYNHKVSRSIMRAQVSRKGKESTIICRTSDHVSPYNGTDLAADYRGCRTPGTVVSNNFITIHGMEGKPGDCSSPYISMDPSSGIIYLEAIHTAGCGGDSYGCPIYQSDFPEIRANSQGFLYPTDVYLSPVLTENIEFGGTTTSVPDGAHVYGKLKKGNFIPSKTCFVPSVFQGNGVVPPLYGVDQYPAALSPFVNEAGEVVNPLDKAKTKQFRVDKSTPLPSWASGLFEAHPGLYSHGFFGLRDLVPERPLRRLTVEEAVFGIPGKLDSIDMTTSEGILLRLKGLKRRDVVRLPTPEQEGFIHPFIYEELDRIEKAVAQGFLPKLVTIFALKDEPRPIDRVLKGETRGFHVGDFIHMIWIRMVLGDLIMFLKKHRSQTVGAIGTNPHGQDWKILRDIFTSMDLKYGGGDYSGYDTGLRCVFSYWMGIDCANYYGYGPCTILYREVVYACMSAAGPLLIVSRTIYWLSFANPSGGYLTGFFNTYCNVVIFSLVFLVLQGQCRESGCGCGFSEETIAILWRIFYGDDNLWGVPPRYGHHWNMKTISELITKMFGMTYTNPDKSAVGSEFLDLEDLEFLKRKWRVVADSLVYATLDESSIRSMLLWIRDTGSFHGNVEQLKVNIGVAGMEMSYYGRPRFEQWRSEIQNACRVYNVCCNVESYEYHHKRFMNSL